MGSPVWAFRRVSGFANQAAIRHRRHVKRRRVVANCRTCQQERAS